MRLCSTILSIALTCAGAIAQNASVTVIHGIPGLNKAVDVFANGSKLFSFDFGASRELSLPPATYNLEVKLDGKTVLSGAASVAANKNYSVIAHLKETSGIQLSVFENDVSLIKPGQSRLIVRHTANAPAVDLGVDQGGKRIATFKGLKNPGQIKADVPAGAYDASLFAAGTSTRAFGPARLSLSPGMAYSVFAIGDLAKKTFRLFVQTYDLKTEATVTVIHGIPALKSPVDVYANGSKLFSFDYGQSKELVLPPATYNLEVRLGGSTVLSGKATVMADGNYSVIAHLKEKTGIQLSVFQNDAMPVNDGQTRVTVRHTANAPKVDVALDQMGRRLALLKNLANPMSTSVEVPAGSYDASLFVAGTSTRAFGPARLAVSRGMGYVVYAIGDVSDKSFRLFIQSYSIEQFPAIKTRISGTACGGRMWTSNPVPAFGQDFDIQLFGATGNDMAFLAVGLRRIDIGLNAACRLYVDPLVIVPRLTSLGGAASVRIAVPRDFGNALPNVYFQWGFPESQSSGEVRTTEFLELSK